MEIFHWICSKDRALFIALNGARDPFLDRLMLFFSYPPAWFWLILAAVAAWRLYKGSKRERFVICCAILVVLVSDLLCNRVLKPLFMRPRPFDDLVGIWVYKGGRFMLTTPEFVQRVRDTMSLPSAHAMNNWSVAIFMFCQNRRIGLAFMAVALIVSYSRIYLGVHYPLDVAAGALLGALLGALAARLSDEAWKRLGSRSG